MKTPKIIAFINPYSDLDKLKMNQAFGSPTMKLIHFFVPEDPSIIEAFIKKQKPDLILVFGNDMREWLSQSLEAEGIEELHFHHPRDKDKDANDLLGAAVDVGEWISAWQLEQAIEEDERKRS